MYDLVIQLSTLNNIVKMRLALESIFTGTSGKIKLSRSQAGSEMRKPRGIVDVAGKEA